MVHTGKTIWRADWRNGIIRLLLIQGANMEYLGRRQPEFYGTTTAKELDVILRRQARRLGVSLGASSTPTPKARPCRQYSRLTAQESTASCSIRRASWTPDMPCATPRSISAPAIESHDQHRETRHGSITAEAAVGMIAGFGIDSYMLALQAMVVRLS